MPGSNFWRESNRAATEKDIAANNEIVGIGKKTVWGVRFPATRAGAFLSVLWLFVGTALLVVVVGLAIVLLARMLGA